MINIAYITLHEDYEACPQLRIIQPLSHLKEVSLTRANKNICNALQINTEAVANADVIIVQRQACVVPIERLRRINQQIKIIFDLDDNFFELPAGHPDIPIYDKYKDCFIEYMEKSDAVTVPSEYFQQYLDLQFPASPVIYLLENPTLRASIVFQDVITKPHILISGAMSHYSDFPIVVPVLEQLLEQYPDLTCTIWGMTKDHEIMEHPRVHVRRDTQPNYRIYLSELEYYQRSIAFVPLDRNTFNHSKSNVKQLEYMSAGIEGIYSALGVYTETPFSHVVPNDTDAWLSIAQQLIEERQKERPLYNKYFDSVTFTDQYLLPKISKTWLKILNNFLGVVSELREKFK